MRDALSNDECLAAASSPDASDSSALRPASANGPARIGGNAAGVVEWADPAFALLTGIALDDLSQKPVSRLLEQIGIDPTVVDFVAERFFEGGPCRVELPYLRPDGAALDVLLEVEPLRNASGEIDRFVATAHARPQCAADSERAPWPIAPDAVAPRVGATCVGAPDGNAACGVESDRYGLRSPRFAGERKSRRARRSDRFDLSAIARRVALRFAAEAREAGHAFLIDLDLDLHLDLDLDRDRDRDRAIGVDPGLGPGAERLPTKFDEAALSAITTDLLEAARHAVAETGNAGAVITLSTRSTAAGRRFVSPAHAIPSTAPTRASGPFLALEVHDTGPMLACDGRSTERQAALARAHERSTALGLRLDYATTSGCGNRALLQIPALPRPEPA